MYCNKCGDPIEPGEIYCNKCGNYLGNVGIQQNYQYPKNNFKSNYIKNDKKDILIGIGIGTGIVVLILVIVVVVFNVTSSYYFDGNVNNDGQTVQKPATSSKSGKYSTAIVCDNIYSDVEVNNTNDANNLIEKDSIDQKKNCPSQIKSIEDDIIKNYGITAVNLCEMDVDFAKELENVIKNVYDNYPEARGYLTNLSLINAPLSEPYIAMFMPIFNFATSNSDSTYPWVIKTQILLNSAYFLNIKRLQLGVDTSSKVGHFPPNATIYSPVAHEFGHYLSFLAMMKSYNTKSILLIDDNNINNFYNLQTNFSEGTFSVKMLKQAYNNYKNNTVSAIGFNEWRGTISKYAVTKDNDGDYIYDETIAEAFHDVYLNGNNAKDASKYIIKVLKSRLEG